MAALCDVEVLDCEPPGCTAPDPLLLECNARGGVPAADAAIMAFLSDVDATDNCDTPTVTSYAPPLFSSGCDPGTSTVVSTP